MSGDEFTTGGVPAAPMTDSAYTGGLRPSGLEHAMGAGYVDFGRIAKPVDDLIEAVCPEPSDFVEGHDGRFLGTYDRDSGVLTVTFDRSGERDGEWPSNPSLTPSECDDYGVDDYGSNAVQLVEREHLVAAVAELLRAIPTAELITLRDGLPLDDLRELVGTKLAEHLFG